MQWLAIGIPALVTIAGFIINYHITKKDFQNKMDEYKDSRIYDLKLTAIREALNFIDSYLSWLTMSSGKTPAREDITILDLTVQARKCYNLLCTTCKSGKIINLFLNIIFPKPQHEPEDKVSLSLYTEFRRAARSELGLKDDITFDKDKVFLSCVSTRDLEKNKQHN